MQDNRPIGVFDSGVGGISIWKELIDHMPNEDTIYLSDSFNAPYGDKSIQKIVELSHKNAELLVSMGAKGIVVACNTATTNAIDSLRRTYSVPIIGIEPATKPAIINTKSGKIGVLATKGTLTSELFHNTSEKHRGDVEIFEIVGTGLVAIIESGDLEKSRPLLEEYLLPMVEKGIDNLVLGCSHYPFLVPIIKSIIPEQIEIIDSGYAVAQHTKNTLEESNLLSMGNKEGKHQFFTNADPDIVSRFLQLVNASNTSVVKRFF